MVTEARMPANDSMHKSLSEFVDLTVIKLTKAVQKKFGKKLKEINLEDYLYLGL